VGRDRSVVVPSASITPVPDLSYFPDADATMPWLVLVGWALVGVALMFGGRYRDAEVVHDEAALEPEGSDVPELSGTPAARA
jgi:hypothetical protein